LVADSFSHTIRRVSSTTVSTFSGAANIGAYVDGAVTTARFNLPWGMAMDASGVIYVADTFNHVIRRISTSGVVSTIAGTVGSWGSADGLGAAARFLNPIGIAVDPSGRLYVTDSNNTVRRVSRSTAFNDVWEVVTLAGSPGTFGRTDGTGTAARFGGAPSVSATGGITVRSPIPTPAPPVSAGFSYALADLPGVAADAAGHVFVSDHSNDSIRMITPSGVVTTIAGSSTGNTDGVGANARFFRPVGIALDAAGNLYVADFGNHTVRKGAVATAPAIQTQPFDQTAGIGGTVTLAVVATGNPVPTFQWRRNGVSIPGATAATLTLSNVQAPQAGNYSVSISNPLGTILSAGANLSVVNAPVNTARIVNLSIRTPLNGAEPLIVGFVATGGPKPLLIRAVGPTLRSFGVSGAMADPQLSVQTAGISVTNDNWGSGSGISQVTLAAIQVGAFALPADSLDSAIIATAVDNAMTAQASSRNAAGGIVLIELYDTTPTAPSRLINVSARANVGGGEDALFAGFVVSGSGSKTLLIRAVGPTLGAFGVNGVLADPRLDIFASGASAPITSNDNWAGNAALAAAFRSVAAFSLPANESKDAALLVSLSPGAYSAQVSGVGGLTGEVLLEIYELP
jgi:sugar lactone lactonase YvrE